MSYTTAEGREQVLDSLSHAAQELDAALASLTEAYEQLDERTAERVEADLFRPVQLAYGRARSTQRDFAERSGLAPREQAQTARAAPSHSVQELLATAVEDARRADHTLASLQDSMLPIEVGDAELRAGLVAVREQLSGVGTNARELLRTFGR